MKMSNGFQVARHARALVVIGCAVSIAGCGTSRKDQLQALARDWFETIRAEQVIPILPLSADIQPGDVFLVQVPIDKQQDAWKKGDYLPLDNHVLRLDPDGYDAFYDTSFFDPGSPAVTLPRDWMKPDEDGVTPWSQAPLAAFPTFTFETSRGGGFSSMLPIQGVPVGLNLLGTTKASGTIVIDDARTYGIDMVSLQRQLQEEVKKHKALFGPLGADPDTPKNHRNYLRIVSRVYLAGSVNVTVQDTRSFAGGSDVGAPRPVELLYPSTLPVVSSEAGEGEQSGTPEERVNELEKGINALNEMLGAEPKTADVGGVQQLVPGGSVRVTTASARTVGLQQRFDPPLVLGYLGFDVEILEGGELGAWFPTHSVLSGAVKPGSLSIGSEVPPELDHLQSLLNQVESRADSEEVLQDAANSLGPDWLNVFDQLKAAPRSSTRERFNDLALAFIHTERGSQKSRLHTVSAAIEEALKKPVNTPTPRQ